MEMRLLEEQMPYMRSAGCWFWSDSEEQQLYANDAMKLASVQTVSLITATTHYTATRLFIIRAVRKCFVVTHMHDLFLFSHRNAQMPNLDL